MEVEGLGRRQLGLNPPLLTCPAHPVSALPILAPPSQGSLLAFHCPSPGFGLLFLLMVCTCDSSCSSPALPILEVHTALGRPLPSASMSAQLPCSVWCDPETKPALQCLPLEAGLCLESRPCLSLSSPLSCPPQFSCQFVLGASPSEIPCT